MTRAKGQFGRRGPPIVTERPKDRPADPPSGGRKRTLGLSLIAAGALAAAAAYHVEGSRGDECVPDTSAAPAIAGAGVLVPAAPIGSLEAKTGGGIGDAAQPCPPGTRRESRSSQSSRRSFAWHGWSSSSSSSSDSTTVSHSSTTTPSAAVGHASSSSTARGGFGSIGGFHSSGHSSGGS